MDGEDSAIVTVIGCFFIFGFLFSQLIAGNLNQNSVIANDALNEACKRIDNRTTWQDSGKINEEYLNCVILKDSDISNTDSYIRISNESEK